MPKVALKPKSKKLRNGPIILVSPQIQRWQAYRKKQGLWKPARPARAKKEITPPVVQAQDLDPWQLFFKKDE